MSWPSWAGWLSSHGCDTGGLAEWWSAHKSFAANEIRLASVVDRWPVMIDFDIVSRRLLQQCVSVALLARWSCMEIKVDAMMDLGVWVGLVLDTQGWDNERYDVSCPITWVLDGLRNLVDPASSDMLVSKIKPCMSQYKLLHGKAANGSLQQLQFIWWSPYYMDNCGNSRANTWAFTQLRGRVVFIRYRTNTSSAWFLGDSW